MALPHASVINCVRKVHIGRKQIYSNRLKDYAVLDPGKKIQVSQTRILETYNRYNNMCYVSFSGGKDSSVLADLTARVCKVLNCKLVLWFSDTGLEFPEVKNMSKSFQPI